MTPEVAKLVEAMKLAAEGATPAAPGDDVKAKNVANYIWHCTPENVGTLIAALESAERERDEARKFAQDLQAVMFEPLASRAAGDMKIVGKRLMLRRPKGRA